MEDISNYKEYKPHRVKRILWVIINATLFRCFARGPLWPLRKGLLKLFGAKIGPKSLIYESCKIFAPWNLEIGHSTCIGPKTELYNKDKIVIGNNSVVSQKSSLCTASHDISSYMLPLITKPIIIGNNVWVASEAFIGPGVRINDGAIIGARAGVFKDVQSLTVVGGNPAIVLKQRKVK